MIQRSLSLFAVAFLALVVLSGCTTIEDIVKPDTRVDYKKGYDFKHIETLAIAPSGYRNEKGEALTDDQAAVINLAIERALRKQGMTMVDSIEDADAIVDWHVVASEMNNVRSYNADSYYQCWRCGPSISGREVRTYTMGTFIVDIIDPKLSKSVWRGMVKGRLADLENVAVDQALVDAAAEDIFSRFPPRIFPVGPF